MKLSQNSTKHGAPMGRKVIACSVTAPHFELEWVPFTDGDYDAGGAYWGAPANLYCAEFGSEYIKIVRLFIRADSRVDAMSKVREQYPDATFEPENGSLIEQMIEQLKEYLEKGLGFNDDPDPGDVEREIADLQETLNQVKG